MITRTIEFTTATALVVWNDSSNSIGHMPFQFSGNLSEKDIEKRIRYNLEHAKGFDETKAYFVKLEETNHFTKLFGMDDDYFLAHATELDPVTRKPLESSYDFS